MTSLIPLFIKTAYKKEPIFGNSKVIFTLGQNTFKEKFNKELLKYCIINSSMKEKDLEAFSDLNNLAMFNGAATYADAISFGDDAVDKKLIDSFSKVKGKKVIPYNPESDLTEYLQLYSDLANK
jgi:starch synthase